MPFTALKQEERNRQRDRKTYLLWLQRGFMIVVTNSSLNDSK